MAGKSAEYKLAIQIAGTIASSFNSSVGAAQGKLSALGKAAGTAMKAAAAASAAATAAVGAFAASSVKTGMEFDKSMSQVAATMGKTVDEVQDLRDFAQEMGATTAFSAVEAADALNYMALAGYDAETSMAMLPNVLNLAAAGSIDLASASDMITDAQSALGLTLDQTNAMVDQMAAASSKSNTSVAQLGEAILTVGGTAQYMAGGTKELNTVLGVLADNGIKGSEGGTHLRNMLLKLSAPTADATKLLNNLGVQVFDAQGNMRSFTEIFPELNAAMSSLTDQERLDAMATLFNSRDIASATALLGTTTERWEELGAAIGDSAGAADQMAKTQLDNLAGDITLFISALEGAQIVLNNQLTPSLRTFVQFGTNAMGELTTAFQEGGLDGAMEALGGILSDGLNMIVQKIPGFLSAGMRLLGALGQGILDNLPAIASAVVTVIPMLVDGIMTALPALADAALQIMEQLASGLSSGLPNMLSKGLEIVLGLSSSLRENAGRLVDGAISLAVSLAKGLADGIPTIVQNVPAIVSNIAGIINDNAPKLLAAAANIIWTLAKGLIQAIPTIVQNIPQIIMAIVDVFTAFNWMNLGKTIISSLGKGIKALAGNIGTTAKTIVQNFRTVISDLPGYLLAIGKDIVRGLLNGIKGAWSGLLGNIKNFFLSIISAVKSLFGINSPSTVFASIGSDLILGLFNGIAALWSTVTGFFTNALAGLQAFFTNAWSSILGAFTTFQSSLAQSFPAIAAIIQGPIDTIKTILEGLKGMLDGIIQFITGVFTGNWSQAWEGVKNIFGSIFDSLAALVKQPINAVISIINSAISGINGISVTIPDWVPGVGGKTLGFNLPTIPQLAEGGIVTGPTILEAGEAGDEAIIPLPELWSNMQSLMADAFGGYSDQLAAVTEQLAEANSAGTRAMPVSDLLADLVGDDEPPEGNGGDGDGDGSNPGPTGDPPPPLVIYYQPHLHFEGGTPSREDIVEAGRISQEEFNRMAAKWQKDAARLSLKE